MFNILGKIDKIAFSIGKFEVAWYAVIILAAIILSVLIGERIEYKENHYAL